MSFTEVIIKANQKNFEPEGYLMMNNDVSMAYGGSTDGAEKHFNNFGQYESRSQANIKEIIESRKSKNITLEKVLNLNDIYILNKYQAYNFLSPKLREEFRVFDTTNVSANMYNYEGHENENTSIILDCGAGFRKVYYDNVIYFDIVDYITTDVVGVGEKLPFRDNSFDYIFSYAVLEHVIDPQKCIDEMYRVLKPGGLIYCDAVFMQPFHGYPSHYFNFTPSGAALLFKDKGEIVSHTVPNHFHPIYSLQWMFKEWANGLSGEPLEKFLNLAVKDIITEMPDVVFDHSYVKELKPSTQKIIAAGTRIVIKKT